MKNIPIGQILLESGYITKQHLEDALVKQKETGKKLGDMLLDLGYAAEGAAPLPNHFNRKPLEETVTYM